MLEIHYRSWAAKVYDFSLEVWAAFRDRSPSSFTPNLCFYIRTVFVSAPVVLVLHAGLLVFIVYTIAIYPIQNFGMGYAKFWMWLVVGAAPVAGIAAIFALSKRLNFLLVAGSEAVKGTAAWKEARTVVTLVRRYLREAHDRICTPIKFGGQQ